MSVFGVVVPVEPVIFVAIGILIGGLIALAVLPLVHEHAVGKALRRLEADKPLAMTEIQAKKDALRADFARAAQRLEGNISDLKGKAAAHLVELARKSAVIDRLTAELDDRTARIADLEAREDALETRAASLLAQLSASKDETARLTGALADAERLLVALGSERDKLESALAIHVRQIDSQRFDTIALQSQVDTVCSRVFELANLVRECADRGAFEQTEILTADAQPNDGARLNGKAVANGAMLAGAPDAVTREAAE